jgi:glycine cleavage system H protein
MNIPTDLLYTHDHEWAKVNGNVATVGISDYAQEALGEIVYLEAPKVGDTVTAGANFGVVESVKAVSDLYSPVSGKVVEVNTPLAANPGTINSDPYIEGWIIKVEMSSADDLKKLMDPAAYEKFVAEESH